MTASESVKGDEEQLVAIVLEMTKSFSGAESTKDWAEDALWFDTAPLASKGRLAALPYFDRGFGQIKALRVEIDYLETVVRGDLGFVCTIQKWLVTNKDSSERGPLFIRQTDCFERVGGVWKIVHEHASLPNPVAWDGKVVK
ncbi:MAG: nuclear transport factor 2 family protein [Deltaproteobacteria bacterium]|jgi:ketosteroid isomerase-like protein|nr:nuclear transport factor 2 family protein [Deltaproteobacteria bacterium]